MKSQEYHMFDESHSRGTGEFFYVVFENYLEGLVCTIKGFN